MAKQYIVKTTVQSRDGKGKKILIKSSPTPQDVPSTLVKELLARGAIEEAGAVTKDQSVAAPGGGAPAGTGDDNTGD